MGPSAKVRQALAKPPAAPQSARMKTLARNPARKAATEAVAPAVLTRRAKLARLRRAEDKADYAIAVKVCARLDSGEEKARPAEDVWRDVGV